MSTVLLEPSRTQLSPASNAGSMSLALRDRSELLDAWWRVKRGGGAAGPDGVSVEAFAGQLDGRLNSLIRRLEGGTYRPGPTLRTYFPKPDGGSRSIAIGNVEDRLLQTAAGQWLQRLVEPLFLPSSFGYRPGKGPRRAAIEAAVLARSHAWVVNADIARFFDNVDHNILVKLLSGIGVEPPDQALLLAWLRATPLDGGTALVTVKGVPQGLPISPPLANLYLHGFDTLLAETGRSHIRYADDFIVFVRTEAEADDTLRLVARYLKQELKLSLKESKTSVVPAERGVGFVGFNVTSHGLRLHQSAPARFRETCVGHLEGMVRDLSLSARRVNELVRGWRAYYGGLSPAIDDEFADLDEWRRSKCTERLLSLGYAPALADAMFESLLTESGPPVVGGYEPEAREVVGAAVPAPAPIEETRKSRRPMDVRRRAVGITHLPWLTDRGDLVVPTNGAFVTRLGKTLVVKWKRQTIFEIPIEMVKHLSIIGQGVAVATSAVSACVAGGIRVWMVDRFGRAVGQFVPARRPVDMNVARAQLRAGLTRTGAKLITEVLAGKIKNQRSLLLYHSKGQGRPEEVRAAGRAAAAALRSSLIELRAEERPMPAARQSLLLIEARAAATYWAAFARLLPPAVDFPGRRRRGATDPVNTLLNYGYFKLLQLVWAAVDRVGLIPWLGLLHTGRRRSPGLILDLMEEFRPVAVDRVVLGLVGRGFRPRQAESGRLRLSSRAALERALASNLERPVARSGAPLGTLIRDQAGAFRRALQGRHPYRPVVWAW